MCGIYGKLSSHQIDASIAEGATDSLAHRGPDERGAWMGDKVFLGMRRLSIIDRPGGTSRSGTKIVAAASFLMASFTIFWICALSLKTGVMSFAQAAIPKWSCMLMKNGMSIASAALTACLRLRSGMLRASGCFLHVIGSVKNRSTIIEATASLPSLRR